MRTTLGDQPEKYESQSRRNVIRALLGTGFTGSILSFVYPAARFIIPPAETEPAAREVKAANASDLNPNSGLIFKFGNRPGLLLRTEKGEWRAFTAICTHLNCTVQYRDDTRQIWCACHDGLFDVNGRVVGGPPPEPLEEYAVNVRGEDVMVSRQS